MIRFNNRQLHTIMGILIAASILIGALFAMENDEDFIRKGAISVLSNISDGWAANYETLDEAKWRRFGYTDDIDSQKVISEVVNLPNTFKVKAGNEVKLSRRIPDFSEKNLYLVFTSTKQHVKITANNMLLYETSDGDYNFPYHIVPIGYMYRNGNLSFVIVNDNDDTVTLDEVKIGSFTELISDSLNENGSFVLYGLFLIVISISLFMICFFLKTDKAKKNMLIYISLESFIAGAIFVAESRLLRIIVGWEFLVYYIRSVLYIIAAVSYLLGLRCLIRRKKILSVVDFGILFYCILFISVIILQWFGLLNFGTIYIISLTMLGVGVIIYTLLIGSAAYDYRQKEERPVFLADLVLICMAVFELLIRVTGASGRVYGFPIMIGCFVYFVILWNYGLKRAVEKKEDIQDTDERQRIIRKQVIDQFNPNLLFASFQTLQKLIKSGSENSTKMIYYISVYFMNNLKAMSSRGEIVSFDDELEHIIAYLQLQKMRSSGFAFAIECKIRDFKIPRNSLEPMVENAVKYGVGGKENKGNVVLRTYEREDGYAIQIIDDGIGFDTKQLKKNSSTALKNLFEMLEEKCKAATEVISKEGKGTVITIVLPMIDNELM